MMCATCLGVLTLLLACSAEVGPSDEGSTMMGGRKGEGESEKNWHSSHGCPEEGRGFAEDVVDHGFGPGESFGQDAFPEQLLGGPQGGGCCAGSLDVVSLGNGGWITLGFGERSIVDGPGPDFLVFENAFFISGDETRVFFELARVEVSEDGKEWKAFECDPLAPQESSCAGYAPTLAHVNQERGDPFDPEEAGGDAFDLADLGMLHARYVRITDIVDDGAVFDLDAVSVVHGECR